MHSLLNDKGYKFSIIRDREFHSSKQVLEGKARQLRQSGVGKRPNKARSLTEEEEEEVLWKEEKFGSKTPEALISSMWWLLTQFFCLRGRQEHHAMKMDDFQLSKMTKVWSSCSLPKVQRRPDRADCRARTEIFSHECSLLEEKGVQLLSSSSLSSEDHQTCYGQVLSTSVSKQTED